MGGRTALRVGGCAGVRSIVGLAPWLPRDEPISQLEGRRILLIHGDRDRMTSPRQSAAVSARLRAAGIASSFVEIVGERHGMLRQPKLWHDLTAGFLVSTLLPDGTESGLSLAPNYLRQVIRGDARITI
jgi:dienelactone hydrolase